MTDNRRLSTDRILLVRTSALGDIVHCLPVLAALRRQLPEARIGWVAEAAFATLLDDHRLLDTVIPVGLRPWRRAPLSATTLAGLGRFVHQLRSFRADVVIDLMGNHKAGTIARLSGASRRIGAGRGDRRESSSAVWINEATRTPRTHVVDRALDLLEALELSCEPVDFAPDALCPSATEAPADLSSGEYVVVQAGAGWGNKRYPAERWGRIAAELHAATGLDVLAVHGPGEEALAAAVASASGGKAQPHADRDLPGLVATLRHAALAVGGDTGPIHLAHALGTPVVCLLGPTDPSRNGPYGAPEASLAHQLPCSYCHQRFTETKICLLDISPEEVVQRCLLALDHAPVIGSLDPRVETQSN